MAVGTEAGTRCLNVAGVDIKFEVVGLLAGLAARGLVGPGAGGCGHTAPHTEARYGGEGEASGRLLARLPFAGEARAFARPAGTRGRDGS